MGIERKLGIKFNKKQKACATAIRWLLNDGKQTKQMNGYVVQKNRATGRSVLMMALIIEKALKDRGKPALIIDHACMSGIYKHNSIAYMTEQIRSMLRTAGITNYRIGRNGPSDDYYLTIN